MHIITMKGRYKMTDNEKLDLILSRLDSIETEMQGMKQKIDRMSSGQLEIKKEMLMLNRQISDTYNVALDALGTNTQNRTWLEKGALV